MLGKADTYIPRDMDAERMANALRRIESAAARIEVAARAGQSSGDARLAETHARLKAEAGAALAQLDLLIGALEQ